MLTGLALWEHVFGALEPSVETTGPWHKLLSVKNWDPRDLGRRGFRGGVSASHPGMVCVWPSFSIPEDPKLLFLLPFFPR